MKHITPEDILFNEIKGKKNKVDIMKRLPIVLKGKTREQLIEIIEYYVKESIRPRHQMD